MNDILDVLCDNDSENARVISFVGAGGKTTSIFNLASKLTNRGKSVIITTTTHIYKPENTKVVEEQSALKKALCSNDMVVVGRPCDNGKLKCVEENFLYELKEYADYVLIEADGAKHLPIKVPKENEPVIPKCSDMVIGIVGIDCLKRPIEKVCFRWQEAINLLTEERMKTKGIEEFSNIDGKHLITEEDIVAIVCSHKGVRKNVKEKSFKVIINKVENEDLIDSAERIIYMLRNKGIQHCYMTSYKEYERM